MGQAAVTAPLPGRPWPIPIAKPEAEWTEFDRDFIDFMRTAYAESFGPGDENGTCIDAGDPAGRHVLLVFRGRLNGWEPRLMDAGQWFRLGPRYGLTETACVCVRPPFSAVAHLALAWLRSRPPDSLFADFEFVGGSPPGVVLRNAASD